MTLTPGHTKLNKQAVNEKDLNSGNYDKNKKVIKQDTINNLSARNQEMSTNYIKKFKRQENEIMIIKIWILKIHNKNKINE